MRGKNDRGAGLYTADAVAELRIGYMQQIVRLRTALVAARKRERVARRIASEAAELVPGEIGRTLAARLARTLAAAKRRR